MQVSLKKRGKQAKRVCGHFVYVTLVLCVCECLCYLLRPFDCSANFNLNFCEPTNYSFLLFLMNYNVKVKVKLFSAVRTTFEQVRGERAHKNANHSLSFVLLLHCNSSKFQLRFQFFFDSSAKERARKATTSRMSLHELYKVFFSHFRDFIRLFFFHSCVAHFLFSH